MSGGSFDYSYFRVQHFREQLDSYLIKKCYDDDDRSDFIDSLKEKTIKKLKVVSMLCLLAETLMKDTEWLFSGDSSEDNWTDITGEMFGNLRAVLTVWAGRQIINE